MTRFKELKEWYETHERPISTISLIAGFVFDSLTLQRIDALQDNLWLALNLLGVGICIILLNHKEAEIISGKPASLEEKAEESMSHFWLFNIMQFGLGNILGGFFILYFRSGSLATSWPFLVILLAALVANELFQKRYPLLVFQLSFFYLSIFSFLIYLVPILVHRIGPVIFILSGIVSLIFFWLFTLALKKFARKSFRESRIPLWRAVAIILISINVLYFAKLIPPIPLSLKDVGIYHYVKRDALDHYVVAGEKRGLTSYFNLRETVHLVSGDSLYVYSAIYSPVMLDTEIIHEWQHKDPDTGKWVTATRIPLSLSGGRAEGFRTFSTKSSLTPGEWRVNVSTPQGALIGRVSFLIVAVANRPTIIYTVKN